MMQTGSMKALMGASANISLQSTPMRFYRQAEAKGDTETMKRTLGYTADVGEEAEKNADKLGEETAKETKAARKQQELMQKQAIEKARRENRSARKETSDSGNGSSVVIQTQAPASCNQSDRLEISDNGRAALDERKSSSEDETLVKAAYAVIYSKTAQTAPLEQASQSAVMAVMDVRA